MTNTIVDLTRAENELSAARLEIAELTVDIDTLTELRLNLTTYMHKLETKCNAMVTEVATGCRFITLRPTLDKIKQVKEDIEQMTYKKESKVDEQNEEGDSE